MTGVLWGLLGATFIGTSDCVARVTAQRVSMSVLLFAVMGLSTVALTVWMAATGDWPRWDGYAWLVSAISGLLNLLALYLLYTALARGPVSVASPAASSFSVVLVGINAIAGQPFVWEQLIAILMVFIGIAMLARRDQRGDAYDARYLRVTALFGLGAAIVVAGRMFLAQEAADVLGSMEALYLNRIFALAGVVCLLLTEFGTSKPQTWPSTRQTACLVALQSLLETLALGSFLVGSQVGDRIGASIGFASFAAVTAIAAKIWLGESIGWRRGLWMTWVAIGIGFAILSSPA
ncbi:MAG: EamA family transporter [Pseudomonadota bacterium]